MKGGVINEFFNAPNVCNVIKLNEQYSPNCFENNDFITGYTLLRLKKICYNSNNAECVIMQVEYYYM